MLTQTTTRRVPVWAVRVARIAFFVGLLTLSAKVRIAIPGNPIPITFQTLVVFLTGMTLGPIEGALTVASYVGAIALGAPLDARGVGPAVFATATAGYLIGFIPAAFVAGIPWKAKGDIRRIVLFLLFGLGAAALVLACGTVFVAALNQIPVNQAIFLTIFPFIVIEPAKVMLATGIVSLGRGSWQRWFGGQL